MATHSDNCSDFIYLDYNATTPMDSRVREFMAPLLEVAFGNPHSEHLAGWKAAKLIEDAKTHVANLIGANNDEVVFTSGATEANNHAIQGILRSKGGSHCHVVASAIEHKSILQTLAAFDGKDLDISILPVNRDGTVDVDKLADCLRDETVLVSIGMANNEIGTIQPIKELAAVCRERGIPFHTDAAQATGKIPIDVVREGIDMLSLSGHKMYGPKGIGALYISQNSPFQPAPLIYGGMQQNGMRAGTVPTFLCVGLGEACRIAKQEMHIDANHTENLREKLLAGLRKALPNVKTNGTMANRLSGNLNIQLPGIDVESLLTKLQRKLAASTGSACNAGLVETSYVLKALGLSSDEIASSIRIGVGRFTTEQEIESTVELMKVQACV